MQEVVAWAKISHSLDCNVYFEMDSYWLDLETPGWASIVDLDRSESTQPERKTLLIMDTFENATFWSDFFLKYGFG